MIVALAGLSKSGKSTLANELARKLEWPKLEFGSYVKHVATLNAIDLEFSALQVLGQSMVENDPSGFVKAVFKFGGLSSSNDVILDGLRHVEVLTALENYVHPEAVNVVLVRIDHEVLAYRHELAGQDVYRTLNGPAEQQVQTVLPRKAVMIVDGDGPAKDTAYRVIDQVMRQKKPLSSRS